MTSQGRFNHRWLSTDDPIAFLKCSKCGMEHTLNYMIGRYSKKRTQYYYRLDTKDDWKPYPPTPPCPIPT